MTPEELLERLEEPRRAEMRAVHETIRRVAPTLQPAVTGESIGYGPFRYRYASGTEGDSFRVTLASRKGGIAIYVNVVDEGGYIAEQAAPTLGKVKVGKSCITAKRPSDLDAGAFEALLRKAATTKGAGEVS